MKKILAFFLVFAALLCLTSCAKDSYKPFFSYDRLYNDYLAMSIEVINEPAAADGQLYIRVGLRHDRSLNNVTLTIEAEDLVIYNGAGSSADDKMEISLTEGPFAERTYAKAQPNDSPDYNVSYYLLFSFAPKLLTYPGGEITFLLAEEGDTPQLHKIKRTLCTYCDGKDFGITPESMQTEALKWEGYDYVT